uniref:Multiple myeloma tumor-associated protein 2-like N-terminal domain-containing protein n=1 Tax=Chrysotila carterae TaxID=13221 RepID=A0A7S4BTV7_CHRCT
MGGGRETMRGGTRGGKDQFSWEEVRQDKHRENYLGSSLHAAQGRWQKGKDLTWYAKARKEDSLESLREERQRARQMEEDMIRARLGLAPQTVQLKLHNLGRRLRVSPPSAHRPLYVSARLASSAERRPSTSTRCRSCCSAAAQIQTAQRRPRPRRRATRASTLSVARASAPSAPSVQRGGPSSQLSGLSRSWRQRTGSKAQRRSRRRRRLPLGHRHHAGNLRPMSHRKRLGLARTAATARSRRGAREEKRGNSGRASRTSTSATRRRRKRKRRRRGRETMRAVAANGRRGCGTIVTNGSNVATASPPA